MKMRNGSNSAFTPKTASGVFRMKKFYEIQFKYRVLLKNLCEKFTCKNK